MKQIILVSHLGRPGERICLGRLFAIWGLFGLASAMLWRFAGGDSAAGPLWIVSTLAALGVLFVMELR